MIIEAVDAITTFRDYTLTVYSYRQKNPKFLAISTGYPIEHALTMSQGMLKRLSPLRNGKEIDRVGYGWNFDGVGLKKTIVNYENKKNISNYYDASRISLTLGGTHGLNQVGSLLKNNRLEHYSIVAIAPVFFRLFGEIIQYADIVPVYGKSISNFIPSVSEIISSVRKNTRAIFLCNPSNPAYKFFSLEDLKILIKEAESRGIYLIIDEVGDAYRYDSATKYTYPKEILSNNVIRICSASKLFLMAEFRLGYVVANPELTLELSKMVSNNVSHINYSACESWKYGLDSEAARLSGEGGYLDYRLNYKQNLSILSECREITLNSLKKIPQVRNIISPDACFSLIFQVKTDKFNNDVHFYKSLLTATGVSIVPGSGFGIPSDEMWFRLSFAYPVKRLEIALNKIAKFLKDQ